jgi:uncharacterized membrane protein (DUF441 family)
LIFLHLAQPLLLTISSVCYPLIAGQSGLPTPDWGRVLRWWRLSAFIGLGLIASTPVIALLVVPVLGTDFQAAVLPGAILVTAKGVAIMGAIPALALIASGRAAQQAVIAAVATCGFLATWLLSAPHQGSVAAAGSVLIAELVVTTAASAAFLSSLRKRSS